MERRRLLQAGAAGAAVGLAGCAGVMSGGNPNVTLGEPDGPAADADFPYPTWGERMPDVSFRDPIADASVNLRAVDRPTFVTFFFTHCQTTCPVLVGALRNVQTDALNEGYADEVGFLPVSFDPERDDAERFRAYAGETNVSLDRGHWRFLRPESVAAGKREINGEFGIGFEKTQTEDGDGYMYNHLALILLANGEGYVERAYTGPNPDPSTLIDDLRAARQARE